LKRLAAFLQSRPRVDIRVEQDGTLLVAFEKLARVQTELRARSRVYAAVVKRLRPAVDTLLTIYTGTGQSYSKDGNAETRTRTWSCEA